MTYQDRLKLMNILISESETVVATDSNSDIITQSNTEEHFDVMTDEGFINQLNRLYTKGNINKEYYLQQVRILKNNYPTMYELIREK